jgi:hypothetical protein
MKTRIEKIRDYLVIAIGPNAAKYSDWYADYRFHNIWGFYGSIILAHWRPRFPTELLRSSE